MNRIEFADRVIELGTQSRTKLCQLYDKIIEPLEEEIANLNEELIRTICNRAMNEKIIKMTLELKQLEKEANP